MATSRACRSELAPPVCCQPPMTDEEWLARGERLDAAMQAARDAQPAACPACGDERVYPLFDPLDGWACGNPACCAMWTVGL